MATCLCSRLVALTGAMLALQGCKEDEDTGSLRHTSTTTTASTSSSTATTASETGPLAADLPPNSKGAGRSVPVGGSLKLLVVASSNAVWMTWVDQMHLLLSRLGYDMPVMGGPPALQLVLHQGDALTCDDAMEYAALRTSRVGRPGWASWDFAFDDRMGCDNDGFREIAGHQVSCTNGWGCWNTSEVAVRPFDVAAAAMGSHAVLLMNWVNDMKQVWSNFSCFGGEPLDRLSVTSISVTALKRLIGAIHARDADVTIFVLAVYPDNEGLQVNTGTLPGIAAVNAAVKEGLQDEPNVVFVDYDFPTGQELFQQYHPGHPNCRADRIIASAAVEAMAGAGLLHRGLDIAPQTACDAGAACGTLTHSCCQHNALCRLTSETQCVDYAPGTRE